RPRLSSLLLVRTAGPSARHSGRHPRLRRHRLGARIRNDRALRAAAIAACAALSALILASLVLRENPTFQRVLGGVIIIAGLLLFRAESLATLGNAGVGGDLLFATAGLFWATFG